MYTDIYIYREIVFCFLGMSGLLLTPDSFLVQEAPLRNFNSNQRLTSAQSRFGVEIQVVRLVSVTNRAPYS